MFCTYTKNSQNSLTEKAKNMNNSRFKNLKTADIHLLKDGLCQGVYLSAWKQVEEVKRLTWSNTERQLNTSRHSHLKNQESSHEILQQDLRNWIGKAVGGLDFFTNFYPTNGSSEGINQVIEEYGNSCFALQGDERKKRFQKLISDPGYKRTLYLLEGEYEGYYHYATGANIPTKYFTRENYREELKNAEPGTLFIISEPSAIDGNYWEGLEDFLEFANQRGFIVWIDLAFHGTTTIIKKTDLSLDCVKGIFFSFSKSFGGCFHDRIGGIFSKTVIPNLIANDLWFHRVNSFTLARELLQTFPVQEKKLIFVEEQLEIIRRLNHKYKLSEENQIRASDVFLIGTKKHRDDKFAPLQRGKTQRLVFTPYMDKHLNNYSDEEILENCTKQINLWKV